MAAWIKTPLGMDVGFGPGDFVRWGPRSPSPKGERGPHLTRLAHSNIAILTQPFNTVKQKHVSISVYEQSQPALEAGYRRDNGGRWRFRRQENCGLQSWLPAGDGLDRPD